MITSTKNIKIKEYLKLRDSSKYRAQKNSFVLEGVRLIFEAIKHNVKLDVVFLSGFCIEKIKDTAYDITQHEKFLLISNKVVNFISGVSNSQGAFAIAKKPNRLNVKNINNNEVVLALYEVKDPGNIGSIIRCAFAFGVRKIVLYNCCDVYNQKVVRSSMGGLFEVNFVICSNFLPFLKYLKSKNINIFASVLHNNAKGVSFLKGKNGVLIIGSEANGLPSSVINECENKVTIKMVKNAESLNVAVACGILLHEMKNMEG